MRVGCANSVGGRKSQICSGVTFVHPMGCRKANQVAEGAVPCWE
jgi:hypothetical protein